MNAIYKHVVDGCIRYIGETSKAPEERLLQHWTESRTSKRNSYRLNLLRTLAIPPVVEVIEWVSKEVAADREKYWISLARNYGHKLTNATDGGEGMINLPPEVRAKMGATRRGIPLSPERCAKLKIAQRRRRARIGDVTPEFRQKMSAIKMGKGIGKPMHPQTRAALKAANTGRKMPREAIVRMIAARRNLPGGYAGRAAKTLQNKS